VRPFASNIGNVEPTARRRDVSGGRRNGSQAAKSALARLPAVHRLLAGDAMKRAAEALPASVVADAARDVLEAARRRLLDGGDPVAPGVEALAEEAAREAYRRMEPSLRGAVNATGIVLHTGLGRARLATAARDALLETADAHSTVEIDRETGRRGSRRLHVRDILVDLTGAEDATVVNNCAAAVLLGVTVLAAGRDVIISRGELVEIGGAFRMPDIVRSAGATLVEVGTTNRTRISDYAAAITERTGLILRCHPSNFAIVGFTEEAPTEELVTLGRAHGIPVMDDQGSGALIAPGLLGLPQSRGTLQASVAAGVDLVTASGDKLLGGPQTGLILGRRALVERAAAHPLARALRVDKLTLAALEATLRLYRDPSRALREIPTLRYLSRPLRELESLAQDLGARLTQVLGDRFTVSLLPERSQVGGGSLPGEDLPTVCVALRATDGAPSADALASHFRRGSPPVFARIKSDALLFDPRTLEPADLESIVTAAAGLVAGRR
jgi:L-seryl-tRNA(Ser) seleniumtransferase